AWSRLRRWGMCVCVCVCVCVTVFSRINPSASPWSATCCLSCVFLAVSVCNKLLFPTIPLSKSVRSVTHTARTPSVCVCVCVCVCMCISPLSPYCKDNTPRLLSLQYGERGDTHTHTHTHTHNNNA